MQAFRTALDDVGAGQGRPQLESNWQPPYSATQHCLQVTELLSLIFGMVENQSGSVDRRQLSRLARTTSAFFGPAIRHLWRDLPDLGTILCLFPDVSVHTVLIQGLKWYTLSSADLPVLSKEAMERFKVYLPHVKRIGCITGFDGNELRVHYTALRTLALFLPRPFFPNLIDVAVPWEDDMEAIFYPQVVFSPSVRHVKVSVNPEYCGSLGHQGAHIEKGNWNALRPRINDIAEDIVLFRVDVGLEDCEREQYFLTQTLSFDDALSKRFTSLTCLEVEHVIIDNDTMTSIAWIPNLDHLKVSITAHHFKDLNGLPTSTSLPLLFPSLTSLLVRVTLAQSFDRFLSHVVASKLAKLKVIFSYSARLTDLNKTLGILGARGMPSHLRELSVETKYQYLLPSGLGVAPSYGTPLQESFDGLTNAQIRVDNDTLKHLSNFTKLTRLFVSPSSSYRLEDSALETSFASWPDLEEFRLVDETMTTNYFTLEPKLTVEGIQRALNLCPSLKTLALRFDCESETMPLISAPHRDLLAWDVGTSSITCGRRFGEWLKEQHPSLKLLDYYNVYRKALRHVYDLRGSEISASDDRFIGQFVDEAMMLSRWDEVAGLLGSNKSMYSYI
ncbi:hypothetical protein FA15DRAFT_757940 [Coprinopsis marcescibilis]|uniref:F-box domain-containing protein n=1 Tax=Coprinopsis marcescibilis TaxID=230819 RepID=A0A5C3KRV4_COPMA|nr:hypothetical protein FA15DRAFT_757940 [Coprinopsis marcescibilis]